MHIYTTASARLGSSFTTKHQNPNSRSTLWCCSRGLCPAVLLIFRVPYTSASSWYLTSGITLWVYSLVHTGITISDLLCAARY